MARIFAIVSLLLSTACGGALANRFEADTGCPARQATQHRRGAGLYEVRGCGVSVRYVCNEYSGTCVRDRERPGEQASDEGGYSVEAPPPPSANAEAPQLETGIHEGGAPNGGRAVRLVLQDASTLIALTGVAGEDTRGAELRAYSRTDESLSCPIVTLRGPEREVRMDSRYDEVALDDLRELSERPFRFDFCGRRELIITRPSLALIQQFLGRLEGGASASSESDAERAVRERIDARQRPLSGCLGGEPGAIVAEWDEAGAVTFSVSGVPADADVQGCVRAAIGELAVTGGASGRVMHPVE